MKKLLTLICVICLLLSGCSKTAEASITADAFTFTDDMERTVTVNKPQRIAVLLGSYAQICQLAGGYVCAAPDDAWEDLNLDMPEDAQNLGSTENLSLELLLASKPDLIVASTNRRQNVEWMDTLETTGIPLAYFNVDDFDDYLRMLEIITHITGRKDAYEEYGTAVQKQIDGVVAKSKERLKTQEPPTVLCMTASATSVRAQNSVGTVLGAMLKTLGCENIADTNTMLLDQLSIEHILVSDPDYIFFVQRGDDEEGMQAYVHQFLTENPAWSQLTAVKNDRVFFMEKNLFNLKPNHRWGEAYENLEEILQNE